MSIVDKAKAAVSKFLGGGTIPKLKIEAFQQRDFTGKLPGGNEITLPLVTSDGGLTQSYAIKWGDDNSTATGESAPIINFAGYDHKVEDFVIKTIIDATGVYRVSSKEGKGLELIKYDTPDIEPYLTELRRIVYAYEPEMHQAPYLVLTWGSILASAGMGTAGTFKCVLRKMDIEYQLFSSTGKPIRAEVTLTLIPCIDPKARITKSSPDLTHIIEVKQGDNLAKLCKQIYESPDYYHQIAQVNGLASAYAIRPGMKLVFPPLDKNTR